MTRNSTRRQTPPVIYHRDNLVGMSEDEQAQLHTQREKIVSQGVLAWAQGQNGARSSLGSEENGVAVKPKLPSGLSQTLHYHEVRLI